MLISAEPWTHKNHRLYIFLRPSPILQLHCSVTIPANLIWIYASFDSNSNCCNFEPSHQMPSFENQKQIMHASIFTTVRDQILNVEKAFLFVQSNIYILFLRLCNRTISIFKILLYIIHIILLQSRKNKIMPKSWMKIHFLASWLDCVSPPHDHPIPHAIILSSRFLSNADGHMQEENIDTD